MLKGYGTYIAAAAVIFAGLACICNHLVAGDLSAHWQECIAIFGGGAAVARMRYALARLMEKHGVE